MTTYIANVEEDPDTGDFVLVFPEELTAQMGWNPGDVITWTDNGNGSWTLSKKEKADEQQR